MVEGNFHSFAARLEADHSSLLVAWQALNGLEQDIQGHQRRTCRQRWTCRWPPSTCQPDTRALQANQFDSKELLPAAQMDSQTFHNVIFAATRLLELVEMVQRCQHRGCL